MNGFIKLHRRIREHWLWEHPDELRAFLDILISAEWKPKQRIVAGQLIEVDRGQTVGSLRYLADRFGWSKDKVKRFLRKTESAQMLRHETRQGITVITVCNYERYQSREDDSETDDETQPRQRRDASETEARQRRDKHEEGYEGKELKEGGERGVAPAALSPIESGLKNFLEACDIEYIPGGISSETMGMARDRSPLFIDAENNAKLCRHAKAWRAKRKRDEEAKGQRFRPVSVPVAMANIDDILATEPGSNGSGRRRNETIFKP